MNEPVEIEVEWRVTRQQMRGWSRRLSSASLQSNENFFVSPLVTPAMMPEDDESVEEEGEVRNPVQQTPDGASGTVQGRPNLQDGLRGGILSWCPDLQDWVLERIGERSKAWILAMYCGVTGIKLLLFDYSGWDTKFDMLDYTLTCAVSSFFSLLVALTLSFLLEGPAAAIDQILNWESFWRFLVVGVFFVLSFGMQTLADRTNLHKVLNDLLGYTLLPIAVFISFRVFRRPYGRLEWLSTAMLSFAIIAFFLVRERCHLNHCQTLFFWNPKRDANLPGILLVIGSTIFAACASIYSELLYKSLSKGKMLSDRGYRGNHLWICKVHQDFAMMQASGWLFVGLMVVKERTGAWPGRWLTPVLSWTRAHVLYVAVSVAQLWLLALVTKRFNTVVRVYAKATVSILVIIIGDAVGGAKYHFHDRWLVSLSLLIIVFISALIFQTGRLNLKVLRQTLHLEPLPTFHWFSFRQAWGSLRTQVDGFNFRDMLKSGGLYAVILLYILADGTRTVLQSLALGNWIGTPAVFVVAINFSGLALANVLIVTQQGRAALAEPWDARRVLRSSLCGFLFALASTLTTLAFALGISPGLAMVVGRFYTPIMAILRCIVMKEYFMWLEWLAIIILSLANLIYGLLQARASSASSSSMLQGKSALLPSAFVLGSAVVAVVNSFIFERLMKQDKAPFIIHKVRVDAGSVLFSALFLPVLGVLASGEEFAFWKARPWTKQCLKLGSCSTGTFVPSTPSDDLPVCECVSGLFVGWGQPAIYLALAANVFHSWITGVLVQLGGSFYRTIADGYSLAVVYFILTPLFLGGDTGNYALSYVCILVPLACLTHTFAVSEMKKVMDSIAAMKEAEGLKDADGEQAGSSSSSSSSSGSQSDDDSESRDGGGGRGS